MSFITPLQKCFVVILIIKLDFTKNMQVIIFKSYKIINDLIIVIKLYL